MKKEVKNNKKKMTDIVLDVNTEDMRWQKALPDIELLMEKVKTAAFTYVQQNTNLAVFEAKKPIIVSVCLSDNDHVQQLNRDFRGKDKPTNVLSFANIDDAHFADEMQYYPEIDLGNIILAYETMVAEAEMQQISLEAHFCHLLTHGFLHLLGFDHIEAEDAARMEKMETEILSSIGIANPYEEF